MGLRRRPVALLALLAACGGDAPPLTTHEQPAHFLFQSRDEAAQIPSAHDPVETALFLEPFDVDAPDGRAGPLLDAARQRQLLLGEWLLADGRATVRCEGERTAFTLALDGLVGSGVYTVWVLATTVALDYGQGRVPTFFSRRNLVSAQYLIFLGPAGASDGRNATLIAQPDGTASFAARVEAVVGTGVRCLAEAAPHWYILLDYHPDGLTFGPMARPTQGGSEQAAQLGFAFSYARPVQISLP